MARSEQFAFVTALLLVGCAAGSPDATSSEDGTGAIVGATPELRARLRDPIINAQLRVLTSGVSARDGVISPASLHAVAASDHQAAESVISGANIGDHAPVFVVQATGGPFTARRSPPGVAPPSGGVLTVTYYAETLEVADIGLDAIAPELTHIDADVIDLIPMAP